MSLKAFRGLLALALLLGPGACSPETAPRARGVVLVTIDTLRADHLGCYGYPLATSPHLDALAREATLYTRAVAAAPWTVPTHASLLTGLDPLAHGAHSFRVESRDFCGDAPRRDAAGELRCENVHPLARHHRTLAEALRAAGFATGAFVGNAAFLARWLQLDQGFDVYEVRRAYAADTNAAALRWLDAVGDRPFFLFLNYMDAHRPYNTAPLGRPALPRAERDPALAGDLFRRVMSGERPLPDGLVERVVAQYDTGVAHADAAVGQLLAALRERGLYEDTVVVITSDHGEYFGEHDLAEHSKDVYEEAVRIPLIVKGARQDAPQRVDAVTGTVAVPRLVAAQLGSPALLPGSTAAAEADGVLAENYYARSKDLLSPLWGRRFDRVRRALYDWPDKLIHSSDGRHELYDLARDPTESRDLAGERPERVAELARRVEARVAAAAAPAPREPPRPLAPEDAEGLRALGYAD